MGRSHASWAIKTGAAVSVFLCCLHGAPAQAGAPARLFEAGRSLVARGQTADGLRAVAAALALDPREAAAQTYLLGVLDGPCCTGDVRLYEAVLAVVPLNRPVLDRTAQLYESRGRYADAAVLHMRGVPLTPDDPEFHARMFLYFDLVGADDLARRSLERYRAVGGHNEDILSRSPARRPTPGGAGPGPSAVPRG